MRVLHGHSAGTEVPGTGSLRLRNGTVDRTGCLGTSNLQGLCNRRMQCYLVLGKDNQRGVWRLSDYPTARLQRGPPVKKKMSCRTSKLKATREIVVTAR